MARLTTLGVTVAYGVETTAGEKPTTFTLLEECSEIGGIELETEQIDVSALEDYVTHYAAGRADTGGNWDLTFIMDPEKSIKQIKKLYADAKTAKENQKQVWFEVMFPGMTDAFFVIAETGTEIPLPDIAQNEAATITASLVIAEYKGLDTKVEPTPAS